MSRCGWCAFTFFRFPGPSSFCGAVLNIVWEGLIPSQYVFHGNLTQLWYPSLDVNAIFVELFGLGPGIENPKIGLSIGTSSRTPLPSSIVGCGVVVHEFGGKIPFSLPPVDMEVFHEKSRSDHSKSIMHVPSGIQLPHTRIHYGKSRLTSTPFLEIMLNGRGSDGSPLNHTLVKTVLATLLNFQGLAHGCIARILISHASKNVVIMESNVRIKFFPIQLTNEIMVFSICVPHRPIHFSHTNASKFEIGTHFSGAIG